MHVNIPESKPLLSSCPRPLPLLLSSSPPSPPSRSARLWEVAHRLPKEVGQVLEAHEPPEHPNVMAAVEQMEGGEVGGEDAGEAGAQEEYAQGAQGQGEEGQAGVEYGQAGAEGVQYTEGGEEFAEGAKAEDEEGLEQPKKRGGHGRRKIEIEYIDDKIRRHITFSKRKAGISKKAYELSRLTGAQAAPLPPTPPAPGSCSAPPTHLRGHPRMAPPPGAPLDLVRARADLLVCHAQAAAHPGQRVLEDAHRAVPQRAGSCAANGPWYARPAGHAAD